MTRRLTEGLRQALEVPLPHDLARRARAPRRPEGRRWRGWTAGGACIGVALSMLMSLGSPPAGSPLAERADSLEMASVGPLADKPPIVVQLEPDHRDSTAGERLHYSLVARGDIAAEGEIELTRYALATVTPSSRPF